MVLDKEFRKSLVDTAIQSLLPRQRQVHDRMVEFGGNDTILADLAHKFNVIDDFIAYITKFE